MSNKYQRKDILKSGWHWIVIFLILSMLSSLFIGKIISASIEYSLENPYYFEKVEAEIVRVEKVESAHNWNDYYVRYAQFIDEETGDVYEAYIYGHFLDETEAQSYIGQKTYILIDREYGKAIQYYEDAQKSGVPIDIIVYSVLLAFCLAITVLSIIKITKKNKKHWIWIAIFILLMLGLAAYVAYASLDMNYINQLKNLDSSLQPTYGVLEEMPTTK